MKNQNDKVWFITGASKGIGLTLVKLLLENRIKVAATSRNAATIEKQIGEDPNLLALTVDITSDIDVKNAIEKTVDAFGGIDIIVNNAGYWLVGSLEELTDREFREALDVNLFGTVNVIRSSLPYLRKQRSGHIINFSSVAGYIGYAGSGSYTASKFAVIGLTESLLDEVKNFGINVTVAIPGVFRTNFLDKSSLQITEHIIGDYQSEEKMETWEQYNGQQPGDPEKLVKILIDITEDENPPLHLLLGPDAYQMVTDKMEKDRDEFEKWRPVTESTNFE